MNKKGQMGMEMPDTGVGNGIHPLLIVGIFIFVAPFFNNLIPFNIPVWISGVGTFVILIGAGLSIMKNM